jgi:hypothetical protein
MNDFELDAKLKSVPLPERTEDYWEDFPAQVRMNLRRASMRPMAENSRLPRLVWAGGFALALIVGIWCAQFQPLKTASVAITKKENHVRRELAQFQSKLQVLMRDEHGMHYLIAEKD